MAELAPGADAPVEPVVPASTDAPAPDSTAEQVVEIPEGEQPDAKPEKTFTQSEVDKLAGKIRAQESRRMERIARAEAERDHYKRLAEEGIKPKQPDQPSGEPKPADFKDWESYNRAVIRWELKNELRTEQESTKKESAQQQQNRQFQERAQFLQEKLIGPGKEKYGEEFEESVMGNVPFTEPMVAALSRLPTGHDIAFHLSNNLAEASRIAQLPDIEQVWAIKDLESKLKATPKPTQTPPPIVPNAGKASVEKRLEDTTSQEEFNAIRKKQIAARRK